MSITIINQPLSWRGAAGTRGALWVDVVGENLSYQWYVKRQGAPKFSKSSVTGPLYFFTQSDSNDRPYRELYCVITDGVDTVTTDIVNADLGSITPLHAQLCKLRLDAHDICDALYNKEALSQSNYLPLSEIPTAIENIPYYTDNDIEEYWDLTQSTRATGTIRGITLDLPSASAQVTYDSEGMHFTDQNSRQRINFGYANSFMFEKTEVELAIAEMDLPSSRDCYLLSTGNGSYGFLYRSTGVWAFRTGGNAYIDTEETDPQLFDDSLVKIVIDSISGRDTWKVYKDGALLFEPSEGITDPSNLSVSGYTSNTGLQNVTISSIRLKSYLKHLPEVV